MFFVAMAHSGGMACTLGTQRAPNPLPCDRLPVVHGCTIFPAHKRAPTASQVIHFVIPDTNFHNKSNYNNSHNHYIRCFMFGVLRSAFTWLTVVFLGLGVGLEVWAPPCFDIQQCLQHGVDNTISTIITGLFTSIWMFGLAIHLWTIKCRSSTAKRKRKGNRTNIRPSAIWAQGYMGLAVLLSVLARLLQPMATLGTRQFWSFNATAALLVALSIYCAGHFAMRSIQMHLRILCCGCCTAVGFTTGLVVQSALVVFGAAVACATFAFSITSTLPPMQGNSSMIEPNITLDNDDEITAMSLRSDVNIFDHNSTRILLNENGIVDIPDFTMERVCQHLFFWGHIALASASFLFWYSASINMRQAIRRGEQKLNTMEGEHLTAWGMRSMTAAHLLPWVSFTIGSLLPVWVVIIAKAKDMDWLQVWTSLRGGVVYHYGLSLMALCLHNCSMTLTYQDSESPPPPTFKFNEDVFHDLTLGIFERNRQDRVERNAIFHDLTLGIFESFDTTPKRSTSMQKHDVYDEELDMQSQTSDDASSADDCGSETTISRLDHQSFGQTRIFQPKYSRR